MADNYLITGYCGKNHVTAENDRGINAGIVGSGRYVLPVGKQFKAELIGGNTVRIYDGKLVDNGAAAGIPAGEYVDLTISNASQGMNRNDLIVFQYKKNVSTLIESGEFIVVQGKQTSGTAVDPTLSQEDLLTGNATLDQMPLWRVSVSTGTISAPVQLFKVSKSLDKAGSGSVVVDAVSSDGVSYAATVEDLEELYNGLEITIIPNIASTTTAPTLNVNGLGAKPIRLSLSLNNSTLVQPKENGYYAAGRPVKLLFDAKYLTTGAWRVANKQRPSAEDIYGTIPISSGGIGCDYIEPGCFLVGNGSDHMYQVPPDDVRVYIGAIKFAPLWENASKGSNFGSQIIKVTTDCKILAIETANRTFFVSTATGSPQDISFKHLDGDIVVHFTRPTYVSKSGTSVSVDFRDCKYIYHGGTAVNTGNQWIIPYAIYGVC